MSAPDIPSAVWNVFPNERKARMRYERFRRVLLDMLENPLTVAGMIIVFSFFLLAILAPILEPATGNDPYQMPRNFEALRQPPLTDGYLLGTTETGGDLLYGIVWGSRLTIAISLTVVLSTTIVGCALGGIAGYVGGWVDEVIMRVVDAMISIPALVWAIAVVTALGPSIPNIIIGLSTMLWGTYARIMRGEVIHVKNEEYIEAAKVVGDGHRVIFLREVIPNAIPPIFVQSTLYFGKVVLIAASVSFIGLAPPGLAEWGVLVSQGQQGLLAGRWWGSFFPGFAIFLWAFGWNIIGDGLRDVLDPRTQVE
ncbi:ABC transporter permease [Halomicroarcula sp. GCM10025324]|uniref:ABC transporter permease n=1 Tax=Haloarcula TaxID=2237 RepID=UPI0023E8CB7C|nr:ABC transporter permease [Halomicroarcula sp. ZS-22-S1]